MNSEFTLVNPVPSVPYFLSSTDLTDATIFAEPDVPLYRVTSDAQHMTICDGTKPDRVIAVFRRGDRFRSDTIHFPSRCVNTGAKGTKTKTVPGKPIDIKQWLKAFKTPGGSTDFVVDTEYGPYVWKMSSRHRCNVFASHDLEKPVASYYLYRSLPSTQPAITLESAGEPLQDDIVVAYLIQRYRATPESKPWFPFSMKARRSNRADNLIPRYDGVVSLVPSSLLFSFPFSI